MHDSRRYHRTRRPTFVRAYGMLGAIGSGLETAGSAVGSGLETAAGSALTGVGKTALSGLESVGQGLQSLFTGGGGEAAKLTELGQTVPAGVELVGPSSTFTGPGFLEAVHQGFVQGPAFLNQFANPSAGTSAGAGLGQLLNAVQQLQQVGGGPAKMPQIVTPGPPIRPPQVIPGLTGKEGQAAAPIMSLLHI